MLDYSTKEMKTIEQWREFYETHETYSYVGLLQGEYYDAEGKQTAYLQSILEKLREENSEEKGEL